MLRLPDKFRHDLVTNIEVLRIAYPGTYPSIGDEDELLKGKKPPEPVSESPMDLSVSLATSGNRIPLTKESLDLMDTPVPSGIGLAAEFAYHGLAPSFLKEMHQAQHLLDSIYSEIKRYSSLLSF